MPPRAKSTKDTLVEDLRGHTNVYVTVLIPMDVQLEIRELLRATGNVTASPAIREVLLHVVRNGDETAVMREKGLQMISDFSKLLNAAYSEAGEQFRKRAYELLTQHLIDRGIS